jgi:hypothetical protein
MGPFHKPKRTPKERTPVEYHCFEVQPDVMAAYARLGGNPRYIITLILMKLRLIKKNRRGEPAGEVSLEFKQGQLGTCTQICPVENSDNIIITVEGTVHEDMAESAKSAADEAMRDFRQQNHPGYQEHQHPRFRWAQRDANE